MAAARTAARAPAATLALCAAARGAEAAVAEFYTSNALCRQNNCVNPIFPALDDLPRLEQIDWQCATQSMVSSSLDFCRDVVKYDPALPSPNATSQPVESIVRQQDDAATTMFFYHMNGLGYDAGELRDPGRSGDQCAIETWRMVCFTYFPKAQAGCAANQSSPYQRPVRGVCEGYVAACSVECCDESVQCVFHHKASTGAGEELVQTGYVDVEGPSTFGTGTRGAGRRSTPPLAMLLSIFAAHAALGLGSAAGAGPTGAAPAAPGRRRTSSGAAPEFARRWASLRGALLAAVAAACALGLHGCDYAVPHHEVGNWRRKPDYLVSFEFIRPGQPASTAILNSCSEGVPETLQCSGRGYCKEWNQKATRSKGRGVSFCECDRDWADPECRTPRKSQVTTFLLALFGGPLGLDLFYLGFHLWGCLKLLTLGGLGFWWVLDIVRAGSGTVYAADFRVAGDLPHWVFVLSTVTLFGAVGFLLSVESYLRYRKAKRQDLLSLQESEEARQMGKMDEQLDGPRFRNGAPTTAFRDQREFSGYGSTLPAPMPNAGAPFAMPPPYGQAGRRAGPFGSAHP